MAFVISSLLQKRISFQNLTAREIFLLPNGQCLMEKAVSRNTLKNLSLNLRNSKTKLKNKPIIITLSFYKYFIKIAYFFSFVSENKV